MFGLGYVGGVTAACLASDGHEVVGVDKISAKVDLINRGASPIVEDGVDKLIKTAHANGWLRATTDSNLAVESTELSIVCVGTPSESNGNLNLENVRKVCEEIGEALRVISRYHIIVLRSTVLPGTMRNVVIPILEQHSGKRAGHDFGICFNPEFMREGTAVHDYNHPPKTVVGELGSKAGDALLELYRDLKAPVFRTTFETAEMVKYVDNTWHALKVGFANEIGSVCKAMGIDSFGVMDIFCQDTKLNLSSYYLRPGYAFGGSCLPKDVRALRHRAKTLDVETPIINSILPSNAVHVQRGIDLVLRLGKRKVGVLGFSFKAGTDDLRESPLVELIERLLGKGYDLLVYDGSVNLAQLTGVNREYILNHIPHIANLMRDTIEEVMAHADVVVIGNASNDLSQVLQLLRPGQRVIDLVRLEGEPKVGEQYEGICW